MSENNSDVSPRPNNLIYHPGRVAAWLNNKPLYPIEVVLMADGKTWLDIRIVKQTLTYLAGKGLKSVTVHAIQNEEFLSDNKNATEIKNVAQELNLAFRVIIATKETEKVVAGTEKTSKPYDKCYALPFKTYITTTGDVYPCAAFIGNQEFCYGNLYEKSFADIWNGQEREKVTAKITGEFLSNNCSAVCDGDEMNKYLHELKHPGAHANFI